MWPCILIIPLVSRQAVDLEPNRPAAIATRAEKRPLDERNKASPPYRLVSPSGFIVA